MNQINYTMKSLTTNNRLYKKFILMNELIMKRDTGNYIAFAKKTGIANQTIYKYIYYLNECMAENNVIIDYDCTLKTFYYSKPGFLRIIDCIEWIDISENVFLKFSSINHRRFSNLEHIDFLN